MRLIFHVSNHVAIKATVFIHSNKKHRLFSSLRLDSYFLYIAKCLLKKRDNACSFMLNITLHVLTLFFKISLVHSRKCWKKAKVMKTLYAKHNIVFITSAHKSVTSIITTTQSQTCHILPQVSAWINLAKYVPFNFLSYTKVRITLGYLR